MKTLNEVITAHEYCVNSSITGAVCEECPAFAKPDCGIREDALHYLREHKEKLDFESALPDYYELVDFWAEQQANPPLSWEQLKQMEGKPVWVEEYYCNDDFKSAGWWLIDYWNDNQICLRDQGGNSWIAHQTSLGRDWQAYRKEFYYGKDNKD